VQPCPYLPVKAGNIREENFRRIWTSSRIFQDLRNMNLSGACGRCEYKDICGGCRARAYYYKGNFLAEEPWCAYRNKEQAGIN
jgi:radical SAM protein with 4Fe4S-binding SPASM domain